MLDALQSAGRAPLLPTHAHAGCRRPCTNKVADERCCDTLFLPSFYFSNAFAFPEDREIGYTIDTVPDGTVIWEATIHAVYFQASHAGMPTPRWWGAAAAESLRCKAGKRGPVFRAQDVQPHTPSCSHWPNHSAANAAVCLPVRPVLFGDATHSCRHKLPAARAPRTAGGPLCQRSRCELSMRCTKTRAGHAHLWTGVAACSLPCAGCYTDNLYKESQPRPDQVYDTCAPACRALILPRRARTW